MFPLRLTGLRTLVVVGAHPDDIEIGAGGLLLALPPHVQVHYVLCTGNPERHAEARAAASAFLPAASLSFDLSSLPDGRLPGHWNEVKSVLERAATVSQGPDLVLAPSRDDKHQDHRLLGELVPTAFRDTLILNYEIPKRDGDLYPRRIHLPMTTSAMRRKVSLLHAHYSSQNSRDWWDDEVFLGLARLRGLECRARYAEAFDTDRMLVRIDGSGHAL